MSVNSFGRLFRFSTWGESHGPAIGAVVDGCPPGLALTEADIQHWLDRRRPGRERPDLAAGRAGSGADPLRRLRGADDGDADQPDHRQCRRAARRLSGRRAATGAGHADCAYEAKYGLRDPRGGGRASARETAARVAAGAVARLVIPEVEDRGAGDRDRRRSGVRPIGRR